MNVVCRIGGPSQLGGEKKLKIFDLIACGSN